MGATSLYHPVSLTVIRGSALYHGIKFGKIIQRFSDRNTGEALYTAELVQVPKHWSQSHHDAILQDIQACFMDDIVVKYLRFSRKTDRMLVDLYVELGQSDEPTK